MSQHRSLEPSNMLTFIGGDDPHLKRMHFFAYTEKKHERPSSANPTASMWCDDGGIQAILKRRSAPGITAALVGMSRVEHAKANARMVDVAPATVEEFGKLFSSGESA